jgi:glycerate dehydrogenase
MDEKPSIVVLDGFTLNPGDNPWDEIAGLGTLTVHDRTPGERIVERARDAHILLTNKTPLRAATLAHLPHLRMIAVLATGYDVIDVAAAKEKGVVVCNVPEYGTDSVAQHVFALLLELCQRVGVHDTAVKAGEWQAAPDFCFWKTPLVELAGKTMGIVGYGRIGRRVGALAEAFGMTVLVHSRTRSSRNRPSWREIPELFAESDVVSLHCPLTPENTRFVDRALLERMRRTAFLINTARGALIDEEALAVALTNGEIAGAAVDVVSDEPIRDDNPLLASDRCIITPHIAWATLSARRRLMETTAANVRHFLNNQSINTVALSSTIDPMTREGTG